MNIDIGTTVMIAIFAGIILAAGAGVSFYIGRKQNTDEDWMVGGRKLPLYVIAFTQYATAVGGGVLVAYVGISYAWGLSVFWYEVFVAVGMLVIAAFANRLHKAKFSTLPEIIGRSYGANKLLLLVTAIAVIVVPFGWLATQFVAFAGLFSEVTGIPQSPLILAMALISLVVVLPGGLSSVAWTDFFFGVFMVGISVVIGAYAIHAAGGFGQIAANVPAEIISVPQGFGAAGAMTILLWAFSILPGTLTNQMYYQRIFASRTPKEARTGIYFSAVMIIFAGFYALAIGLAVRSMNPNLGVDGREGAAGWFLTMLPPWLLALYGAFLMATIVSTTGSALQSVVANMVFDLRGTFMSEARQAKVSMVSVSRWATVVVTLLAAVLAIAFPNALDWLVATYAYSAAILAVPLIAALIRGQDKPAHSAVAFSAMAAGLTGCAGAHLIGTPIPYAIFGIAASLIGYFVALAVTRGRPAVQSA